MNASCGICILSDDDSLAQAEYTVQADRQTKQWTLHSWCLIHMALVWAIQRGKLRWFLQWDDQQVYFFLWIQHLVESRSCSLLMWMRLASFIWSRDLGIIQWNHSQNTTNHKASFRKQLLDNSCRDGIPTIVHIFFLAPTLPILTFSFPSPSIQLQSSSSTSLLIFSHPIVLHAQNCMLPS